MHERLERLKYKVINLLFLYKTEPFFNLIVLGLVSTLFLLNVIFLKITFFLQNLFTFSFYHWHSY
jgi:hypothetical protein